MEITATAYDATESPIGPALRRERKEAADTQQSARTYDTVSISPQARALAQTQRGDDTGNASTPEDRLLRDQSPPTDKNVGTGVARGGDSQSEGSTVEQIQKQIREAEQKLAQAQEELSQAMVENEDAGRTVGEQRTPIRNALEATGRGNTKAQGASGAIGEETPETGDVLEAAKGEKAGAPGAQTGGPTSSAPAPAESSEVKMLQMKIASINAELTELRQALQEAIKSGNG